VKKNKLIIFIFIITLLFMISGCMKSESVDNSKDLTTSSSPPSATTVAPTIKPTMEPSTAPIIAPTTVPTVAPIIQTGTLEEQSMDAYKKFMENEAKVSFDRYMPMDYDYQNDKPLFNKGSDYTLSEVLDIVTAHYFDIFTDKKIDYIDYSYIDCGKDGVNELVLRFNGMDIYCEDDGSTLVYIIKYIDGKLSLCYYYETWARRDSTLNEYGYFESGGSNGASNQGYDCGVIDKDGNWQFIVYIEMESDINQMGQISEVAETKGIYDGIELDTIRFNNNENADNTDEDGNKEYYTFYAIDDNWNLIEDANLYTDSIYKDVFDEASVAFITPDEVSTMISEKEEKVGATDEIKKGKEVIWKTLGGNIFSDYLKSKVKLDTLVKNGLHVFEDQSFDVELDNFGYVRFVSGVDGYKELWLYLVNSNKEIIYVFPGFYENKLSDLQEVEAVSFKDINKDGLKDITIIAHCLSANGGELTMANVYFQKDKGFINSYELDEKINDTNNNNSINKIAKYVSGLNLSTFGIK
jgi:hypothetical protein